MDFQQEPEIYIPAEIQFSMSSVCEGSSDATRPDIPETVAQPLGQPEKNQWVHNCG